MRAPPDVVFYDPLADKVEGGWATPVRTLHADRAAAILDALDLAGDDAPDVVPFAAIVGALEGRGAWYLDGYYRAGLRGTSGERLDVESDNLGHACRAWKRELAALGYAGGMKIESPVLGSAFANSLRAAQKALGLAADGRLGPKSGRAILRARIEDSARRAETPPWVPGKIVSLESVFDVGAIGYVDYRDRGPTQTHIYETSTFTLSQTIDPAWSIPRLAFHIKRYTDEFGDLDVAIASWNAGVGGARAWQAAGKPATGGPSWSPKLYERCTTYVRVVRAQRWP